MSSADPGSVATPKLAVTRRMPSPSSSGSASSSMPGAHALGQVVGALEVGARENDGQLLAAVAGGLVDLARGLAQHAGHLAQHEVALLVAVGVVDVLEVVEVEQDEAHRLAEALGALDLGRPSPPGSGGG